MCAGVQVCIHACRYACMQIKNGGSNVQICMHADKCTYADKWRIHICRYACMQINGGSNVCVCIMYADKACVCVRTHLCTASVSTVCRAGTRTGPLLLPLPLCMYVCMYVCMNLCIYVHDTCTCSKDNLYVHTQTQQHPYRQWRCHASHG